MNNDWNLDLPDWHLGTPPDLISSRVCVIWYMDDYEFGMWSAPRQDWLTYLDNEWQPVQGEVEKWCLLPREER